MKQYLLSVHGVEGDPVPAPEVIERMYAAVDVFNKKVMESGNWVFGGGLHRDSRTQREWQGDDDRRPLRRSERAVGWLLDHQGTGP